MIFSILPGDLPETICMIRLQITLVTISACMWKTYIFVLAWIDAVHFAYTGRWLYAFIGSCLFIFLVVQFNWDDIIPNKAMQHGALAGFPPQPVFWRDGSGCYQAFTACNLVMLPSILYASFDHSLSNSRGTHVLIGVFCLTWMWANLWGIRFILF